MLRFAVLLLVCGFGLRSSSAQSVSSSGTDLAWNVEASGGQRFVAAHGERSLLMGYGATGLELWAYPLQVFRDYTVSFREPGLVAPLPGLSLLRRIQYSPDEVVRVYVGPDFVVREHLFVPRDVPGCIITYVVEGRAKVTVLAHFTPSLNLMWPGALSGQGIGWDAKLHGYRLNEPVYGFAATVASPDVVAHDAVVNRTVPTEQGYTLELQPKLESSDGPARAEATLYAALDPAHSGPAQATVLALAAHNAELQAAAAQHTQDLLQQALTIETPDAEVNRALAWAVLALDHAWVCNPQLGCGEVAGYGPSRPGRRPQYAWFFAGDGLVATEALLAAGENSRAREELTFITGYQNKTNGMIWHELSQSAALIDWVHRYPYMYVHVDTTFQYLATVGDYLRATGDREFVAAHWANLEAAWRYCTSLVKAGSGLPEIPAGEEGEDEQDRLRDELSLSSLWVRAARAYAELASSAGHTEDAVAALRAAKAGEAAIAAQYWDTSRSFWISGHTVGGKAIEDQRSQPAGVLTQGIFSPEQTDAALDKIVTPAFQTDWGVRGMSSRSPDYEPDSYSKGSVSALATATLATAFWQAHRPLAGWQIWSALVPWNTLDSAGHMHEVLAGNLYHPEIESVPEQTWSSAGFLSSAMHGLLGLEVDAAAHELRFAPHLPLGWDHLALHHLRVGASVLDARLTRSASGLTLDIENNGAPVTVVFEPEIPLGAALTGASINGKQVSASLAQHPQETQAMVRFVAPRGAIHCVLRYSGGVEVEVLQAALHAGDASRGAKIAGIGLNGSSLTLDAFVDASAGAAFALATPWKVLSATGAVVGEGQDSRLLLTVPPDPAAVPGGYVRRQIQVQLRR